MAARLDGVTRETPPYTKHRLKTPQNPRPTTTNNPQTPQKSGGAAARHGVARR
jgi:hypothetical protein